MNEFNKEQQELQSSLIVKNIIPINNGQSSVVQLNESGSSYLIIHHLNDELKESSCNDFNNMWSLHPEQKHKVIRFEKEIEVHRYSKSYLKTPTDLSHLHKSSYMYSGYDTSSNNDDLPEIFQPYYQFFQKENNKYNQMIANWYENEFDYIAHHSDCQKEMIQDSKISILSLYPHSSDTNHFRYFQLKPKIRPKLNINSLADEFNIRLDHGSIITMCGSTQQHFTHSIQPCEYPMSPRISLSFRQMI